MDEPLTHRQGVEDQPEPCSSFTLDVASKYFGTCTCGHAKAAHDDQEQTKDQQPVAAPSTPGMRTVRALQKQFSNSDAPTTVLLTPQKCKENANSANVVQDPNSSSKFRGTWMPVLRDPTPQKGFVPRVVATAARKDPVLQRRDSPSPQPARANVCVSENQESSPRESVESVTPVDEPAVVDEPPATERAAVDGHNDDEATLVTQAICVQDPDLAVVQELETVNDEEDPAVVQDQETPHVQDPETVNDEEDPAVVQDQETPHVQDPETVHDDDVYELDTTAVRDTETSVRDDDEPATPTKAIDDTTVHALRIDQVHAVTTHTPTATRLSFASPRSSTSGTSYGSQRDLFDGHVPRFMKETISSRNKRIAAQQKRTGGGNK